MFCPLAYFRPKNGLFPAHKTRRDWNQKNLGLCKIWVRQRLPHCSSSSLTDNLFSKKEAEKPLESSRPSSFSSGQERRADTMASPSETPPSPRKPVKALLICLKPPSCPSLLQTVSGEEAAFHQVQPSEPHSVISDWQHQLPGGSERDSPLLPFLDAHLGVSQRQKVRETCFVSKVTQDAMCLGQQAKRDVVPSRALQSGCLPDQLRRGRWTS